MSNNVTFSKIRRLGLEKQRFRSNSQDMLNENSIQDRLNAELNWLEGSRPSSVSIEDLLKNSDNTPKSPISSSSVEEKKKKLTQAGLFRDRLKSPSSSSSPPRSLQAPSNVRGKMHSTFGGTNHARNGRSWNSSSESESGERKIKSIMKDTSARHGMISRLAPPLPQSAPVTAEFPPPPDFADYGDIPSGTEGSEYSIRSSALQSNTEVDTRVEAMEQKLYELSQKFDTIQKTDNPSKQEPLPDEINEDRRIKSLERELTNEKRRIEELEERLREHEDAIQQKDDELVKSRDRIYDLERDVDHAGEVELMKNEQLINLRDMTREMLRNLSDLRSEITSTRRAQIDMRRSMQQEVNTIQTSIIQQLEEYDQVRPPRVADFGSDTLTRLQLDRSSLEKQKAEYSNESDLVDDALKDVENSVDQMRNDAISGKSKMSRKEIESVALQLMNVASKISDLKEKLPDLEDQMRKVTGKEHDSIKREAMFINDEPVRLDDSLERCKALTGTLQTLKKLAGVQEKHRTYDNDGNSKSLSRSYRANGASDPIRLQKALLNEIEHLEIDHGRRHRVIKDAEPRWAMQSFRNRTYEKAKFEKLLSMKRKELHMTQNVDINAQRHAEHLRQLYLAEKQESKDLAINNQTSYGGTHLPYGGGTLPKNASVKGHTPQKDGVFSHRKQRSWDMLDTTDELRVTNVVPTYATIRSNHFQSDQIEKMAAISSPNLVRASMHMRGELGTTHKPLLVATKSQGHLADHGGYGGGVDEEKTRPISSYDYGNYEKEHDYGPLIIDSVVQPPVVSKEKKANDTTTTATPKSKGDEKQNKNESKSKFGFGLRKSVFSRNKKTHDEKPTPPISAPIGPPTIGTGTQLGAHHYDAAHHTLTKDKGKDDKKGFARLASFSRKKKNHNDNKSSTEDIVDQVKSPTSLRRPQKSQTGLKPPQATQNPGLLSPRPYRTPASVSTNSSSHHHKLKPPPSYQKSPPVQFERSIKSPLETQREAEWSKPERRQQHQQQRRMQYQKSPPPAYRSSEDESPYSQGQRRFGFASPPPPQHQQQQRPPSQRMKTSDV